MEYWAKVMEFRTIVMEYCLNSRENSEESRGVLVACAAFSQKTCGSRRCEPHVSLLTACKA